MKSGYDAPVTVQVIDIYVQQNPNIANTNTANLQL